MLATNSTLPAHPNNYAFEFKWDGIRALAYIHDGALRLVSRRGNDVTAQYPELVDMARHFEGRDAVLDGEIVALDAHGRPDFGLLQQRMNLQNLRQVSLRSKDVPVQYFAFDLLFLDGRNRMRDPYTQRRALLQSLSFAGPSWQTPPHWVGEGAAVLDASRAMNLEGIVAKRLDSPYTPSQRTMAWLKIKTRHRQEFVVGGWTPGEGSRGSSFGSLLVGYYESSPQGPQLVYAGRVGSGFDDRLLKEVERRLQARPRETSPFAAGNVDSNANYVEPTMVIDVEFAEWTHLRTLRQASFKGLRMDKDPQEVRLERTIPAPPGGEE